MREGPTGARQPRSGPEDAGQAAVTAVARPAPRSSRRETAMPKPCQNCQKNPATVHLTEIQDNRMTELHLCQSCAEEKGLAAIPAGPKFAIGDLLAHMVDGMSSGEEEKVGPVQCPGCGML